MRWLVLALMLGPLIGCPQDSAPAPPPPPPPEPEANAAEEKPKTKSRLIVPAEGIAVLRPGTAEAEPRESRSPLTQEQKIERLIQFVAELKDATFVRNGEEHTATEAAEHMRRKWQWKKKEIRTAEDFIRLAATASSTSGEPYVIGFADGREIKSAEFLGEKLAELE